MRYVCQLTALAASILAPAVMLATPGFVQPANLIIGQNLQVPSSVRLTEGAPESGLLVTVTSDDPARLLFTRDPTKRGEPSITLKINGRYVETPDFLIQALANGGNATYTVSAPGFASVKGTVNLAPSAVVLLAPFKAPVYRTPSRTPVKITVHSVVIEPDGKFGDKQQIAGGMDFEVEIKSSDPKVGAFSPERLKIHAGEANFAGVFKPAGVGSTTLSIGVPPGFSVPPQYASAIIDVELPGIGIMGEVNLGKDLQIEALIMLGEMPPPEGVDVTITSSDPKKLLLSTEEEKLGKGSITVHIPAGELRAPYYLQSLGDSGTVICTATAPGFRTRTGPIHLTPSGFMVVYAAYGPPDEAEILRVKPTEDPRPFTVTIGDSHHARIAVWSVYLHPETKRGADITTQRLRPGLSPVVKLKNSNPSVGKTAESVTFSNKKVVLNDFIPLSPGETTISVVTPPGFTTPSNANSVTAIVKQ